MCLWVQMGGPVAPVGSPDQAQMLAAAQQGFMHPGYAMYGPGMMCMGPQVSMSAKAPLLTASSVSQSMCWWPASHTCNNLHTCSFPCAICMSVFAGLTPCYSIEWHMCFGPGLSPANVAASLLSGQAILWQPHE